MKHLLSAVMSELKKPSVWVAVGVIVIGWSIINSIGRKYIPGYATVADKVNSLSA